ncbi:MAG: hypothetical protein K0R54_261 [Clostridiaceae bacterium]|jgi:5'(3')-deoxyribonucleotidase|nr:hypothetical protein [Clostridiaceae bacterium]
MFLKNKKNFKKLHIILDSDGVLLDCMKKVLEKYNKEYGTDIKYENILAGNLKKVQLPGTDMNKYFNEKGFFRNLEPLPDSQYYVAKLIEDGHDIVVATASPVCAILDKIECIKECYPTIPEENIIPISRKDLLFADIALDDGLHNIVVSKSKYPTIFDQPWNRMLSEKYLHLEDNKRIHDWKEFYEFVCEVASQPEKESIFTKMYSFIGKIFKRDILSYEYNSNN